MVEPVESEHFEFYAPGSSKVRSTTFTSTNVAIKLTQRPLTIWESITEPTYLLTFSLLKSNLLVKVDVLPQLVEKKIRRYSSNQSDELSFTNKRLSFSIKSFQINFSSFTKNM